MNSEASRERGPVEGPEEAYDSASRERNRNVDEGGRGVEKLSSGQKGRLVSENEILGKRTSEIGLAKTLGVSRKVLREHRIEGEWVKDGRTVYWSKNGALAVAKKLGCVLPNGEGSKPISESENGNGPIGEAFKVVRNCMNPHVLMAARGNGEVVSVRVTKNANFRPGMELRAALTEYGWTSIGRTPRFPGRW